jgi:hypothetical protein
MFLMLAQQPSLPTYFKEVKVKKTPTTIFFVGSGEGARSEPMKKKGQENAYKETSGLPDQFVPV